MRPIAINGDANRRVVVVGDDDWTIEVDGVMEAEDGDDVRGALIDSSATRAKVRGWCSRAQLSSTLFIKT